MPALIEYHNPSAATKQLRRYEALLSIVDANRTDQWRLVRDGHPAWRLTTAEMATFHCGRLTDWRDFDRMWDHNAARATAGWTSIDLAAV